MTTRSWQILGIACQVLSLGAIVYLGVTRPATVIETVPQFTPLRIEPLDQSDKFHDRLRLYGRDRPGDRDVFRIDGHGKLWCASDAGRDIYRQHYDGFTSGGQTTMFYHLFCGRPI